MILAIDPGTTESAYVLYDEDEPERALANKGLIPNEDLLLKVGEIEADLLAIEMIASYGMPVGKTTFETTLWIGRFIQRWKGPYRKVYRKDVKMHLCQSTRAKDSNIRQALLDLYPRSGGGATPQVGIKAEPGPLYGVAKDIWAALGVAKTAAHYPDLDTPICNSLEETLAPATT